MDDPLNRLHNAALAKLSFEEKWQIASDLYYSAWRLKAAALRTFHPEWNEERVESETRRAFFNART